VAGLRRVALDRPHRLALAVPARGKAAEPWAVIMDGRTMRSTPESGGRAGYDGYQRKKGSKVRIAVDTLGFLLAARITPANEQERQQVDALAQAVQEATGEAVEVAYVDQGTPASRPNRMRPRMASNCVSSSCLKRKRASSC
jgi:hypothetical protein